jgi:hypothetical protein
MNETERILMTLSIVLLVFGCLGLVLGTVLHVDSVLRWDPLMSMGDTSSEEAVGRVIRNFSFFVLALSFISAAVLYAIASRRKQDK